MSELAGVLPLLALERRDSASAVRKEESVGGMDIVVVGGLSRK